MSNAACSRPQRIVCLTAETTELLYLLGTQQRIIADREEVVRRAPELIIGSWCGKRFRPERVRARAGWEMIPAVRNGRLHEIKSCDILQPGPAALTDGLRQLQALISSCAHAGAQADAEASSP